MASVRFILILAAICGVIFLLTYLLHRLFKKYRYIKYSPALVLMILTAYYFYLSKRPSTSFEDIGYIIIAIMFLFGGLSGIVSALILDFAVPKFFKNK